MKPVAHLLKTNDRSTFLRVAPDVSVFAALELLSSLGVGALMVMDGDKLIGIFSERDYARGIVLKGRSSATTPVAEIMQDSPITVGPEDTIDHCMRLCTNERVRYLPVIEQANTIGVVSLGDLVKAVISEQSEQIEQLQRYIAG